jgi:hypothetical protein
MLNPVIIIAIIGQALVSKFSRTAGAIVGYLITTGILAWGITVYAGGDQVALFKIGLSESVFFIVCLIWYAIDTFEFSSARKQSSRGN